MHRHIIIILEFVYVQYGIHVYIVNYSSCNITYAHVQRQTNSPYTVLIKDILPYMV